MATLQVGVHVLCKNKNLHFHLLLCNNASEEIVLKVCKFYAILLEASRRDGDYHGPSKYYERDV